MRWRRDVGRTAKQKQKSAFGEKKPNIVQLMHFCKIIYVCIDHIYINKTWLAFSLINMTYNKKKDNFILKSNMY